MGKNVTHLDLSHILELIVTDLAASRGDIEMTTDASISNTDWAKRELLKIITIMLR